MMDFIARYTNINGKDKIHFVIEMRKQILTILTTILTVLTIIFCLTYFSRLKMDYNSEGNYIDETSGVVYHEQAVLVFGIIAFTLFLLTILTAWRLKKKN